MVKTSTLIGVAIVGVVGVLIYFFLGKGSGLSSNPSIMTPQSGQIGAYPSATSQASGGGLSVSEVYNYSPSSITESTHTYQTTNNVNATTKLGFINT